MWCTREAGCTGCRVRSPGSALTARDAPRAECSLSNKSCALTFTTWSWSTPTTSLTTMDLVRSLYNLRSSAVWIGRCELPWSWEQSATVSGSPLWLQPTDLAPSDVHYVTFLFQPTDPVTYTMWLFCFNQQIQWRTLCDFSVSANRSSYVHYVTFLFPSTDPVMCNISGFSVSANRPSDVHCFCFRQQTQWRTLYMAFPFSPTDPSDVHDGYIRLFRFR